MMEKKMEAIMLFRAQGLGFSLFPRLIWVNVVIGLYRDFLGIAAKTKETTIWGFRFGDITPVLENQMESRIENRTETGIV